jgi:hypothetical protein
VCAFFFVLKKHQALLRYLGHITHHNVGNMCRYTIIFIIKLRCNRGRSSLFDQFTPEIREKLPTVAIHKWIIFRRLIRSVRFVRLGFLPFGLTCPGLFASWSLYRQGLCVWRETETHTRSQTHQKINLAAGYNSRPYFNRTRTRSGKLDYKHTSNE